MVRVSYSQLPGVLEEFRESVVGSSASGRARVEVSEWRGQWNGEKGRNSEKRPEGQKLLEIH